MAGDRTRSAVFFGLYAAMLLYGLYWVRLSDVRDRVQSLTLFYVLIGAALCYLALRAVLVILVKVSQAWDPVWVAIDLIIITVAVRLTGGIDSEAALLYFWPIATYAIRSGRCWSAWRAPASMWRPRGPVGFLRSTPAAWARGC
ncbi:MAG: hypothetical protein U9R79_17075 [Armatimonadota bacterium]|nr:hypothetical protein [Armatimonadota bacterium]